MLISSSFLSAAAWRTEHLNPSTRIATQNSPEPARHSDQPVAQQKPTEQPSNINKGPNRHGASDQDQTPAATSKKDALRGDRPAEAQRRPSRRAHQKPVDDAQPMSSDSGDGKAATPANQEAEPPQFLAILGDVLPQDKPTDADSSENGVHPELAQFAGNQGRSAPPRIPFGPGISGGTGTANLTANASLTAPATQAGIAGKSVDAKQTAGAAETSAPHAQPEISGSFDSAVEIKREPIANGLRTGVNPKTAKPVEVAFAARIAGRTAAGSALALNDAQATIAASRFDAASTRSQSGAHDHAAPHGDAPLQDTQLNPSVEAAPEQPTPAVDSQTSPEPDAHEAGIQNAAARSASAGTERRTEPDAVAFTPGPHAVAASQNATPGMPVTATVSTMAQGGSQNSGAAKPAADAPAPQFLEPQNETTERPGESVRDISLKLTNKDQASVQVRLSERAGELHVSVRTPDAGLTRGLREGLSDLVGRLEHNGYRAETWQPADSASTAQDQGHDSGSQRHSPQQQNDGGSEGDARQQQNSRDNQQPDGQIPQWVGELESSLQRSNRSWLPSATL